MIAGSQVNGWFQALTGLGRFEDSSAAEFACRLPCLDPCGKQASYWQQSKIHIRNLTFQQGMDLCHSLVVDVRVFAASPVRVELTVFTVLAARESRVVDADVSVACSRLCSAEVALVSVSSWSVVS